MEPVTTAAVIGGAVSIAGGLISNRAKRREAQKNRDFQAQQSGSAHQRQVADMRAAGLNPILSGTGGAGASTSAGSMAQQEDVLTPGLNSALAAKMNKAQVDNLERENVNLISQNANIRAQTQKDDTQANLNIKNEHLAEEQRKLIIEQTHSARELAKITTNERISSDMDLAVTQTKGEETRRLFERWLKTIGIGGTSAKSLDYRDKKPSTRRK